MADKIHKGDIGTVLTLDAGVDLSGFSTTEIHVKKPDGTKDAWTAVVGGAGNTEVSYTTVDGDHDQEGTYRVWAFAKTPGQFHGEVFTYYVHAVDGGVND